jgi:predicted RNA-binding protein YlxR (DUF448 family)
MMKTKKIPMRMCMACKERKPKKELVRIVRDNEGNVSVDLTGKKMGRGAYICHQLDCLERAVKSKALERALEVKIDTAVYDQLKEDLTAVEG